MKIAKHFIETQQSEHWAKTVFLIKCLTKYCRCDSNTYEREMREHLPHVYAWRNQVPELRHTHLQTRHGVTAGVKIYKKRINAYLFQKKQIKVFYQTFGQRELKKGKLTVINRSPFESFESLNYYL